ncbi:MAG: argininosuccinate lyase [Vulcanimicrobiaceae bacterium]
MSQITEPHLQWGGRFTAPPDPLLLAFGSSLRDDLVLAPFDLACSQAHVDALAGGGVIDTQRAEVLQSALTIIAREISDGTFLTFAKSSGTEDIHGAIDARVRTLCPHGDGDWLHAGRSRNDQVATTLALYAADRAASGIEHCRKIATLLLHLAELHEHTVMAGTTHGQPAQPISVAFWLLAAAEPFLRSAKRFAHVHSDALHSCPLGSAALAGSSLPLDRKAAAKRLRFATVSRNAMDAIGTRDALLDVANAYARTVVEASRIASDMILWSTPALGYVRLGDASATGSSLMPQKRNPDPFELVRGAASEIHALASGAVTSLIGLGLSYHRDLQQTKRMGITAIERATATLSAFTQAVADVTFLPEACARLASTGYTVATDIADALITHGTSARQAHALVGAAVGAAEQQGRELNADDLAGLAAALHLESLDAPLDAQTSIAAKATEGSTAPWAVRAEIDALRADLLQIEPIP